MTRQAPLVDFLRRGVGERKYLVNIATSLHVSLAGAMAVLAGEALVPMHEYHLGVRVVRKAMSHIGMTGLAHLRTDISGWKGGILLGLPRFCRGSCRSGSGRNRWMFKEHESEDEHDCEQQGNSSH